MTDLNETKEKLDVLCVENIMDNKQLYCHWSKDLTIYLKKGNVSMSLTGEEVQQIIKCLPRTIGGTY